MLATVAQSDTHPTGDQEVRVPSPPGLATAFHGDYEIFFTVKKSSCQFLLKESAQVLFNRIED